ncbi:hypothetical protein [Chitinophaga sp. sic0106]|uniref:hypothetical protein n=1 Tax=Chitinophaga sp. sic0106 TaxID=2854785 RepID=UPI001C45A341|nr:hypothetical protein [Chitinophaga sp. sic0106]MBV7530485.1 hypothetical protein [Chitinophaga sp. sic0106]
MNPDVKAKFNPTYMVGGEVIRNKYMPLTSIAPMAGPNVPPPPIEINNIPAIQALFQKRIKVLQEQKVSLTAIYFRGITDDEIIANEQKTKLPPIVIVSSGRADWIKATITNGQNAIKVATNYTNTVQDPQVFKYGPVPFYFPQRYKKDERNFYLFVHQSEYEHYKTTLDGLGITIIGWNTYRSFNGNNANIDLCLGFGMSRYVVFQFFKDINYQNKNSGLACKKIWMLDDNVCHIDAFPGFNQIETATNDQYYGVGFFVENTMLPDEAFSDRIYNGKPYKGRFAIEEAINLQAMDPLRFLQQAVLWNFNKIPDNLSFSPYFIGSNEDITFSRVLATYNNPPGNIFYTYRGVKVLKTKATPDKNSPGLTIHNSLKKTISANLNITDHRAPLIISTENPAEPKDLFDYIQGGMAKVQAIEAKYTSYVKSAEQLSRTTMFITGVKIFDAVPQDCFITPDLSTFKIIRYK